MYTIKKNDVNIAPKLKLSNTKWGYNDYKNDVFVQLSFDDEGFFVKFTVCEKNPLREKTEHFQFVHEDSCVEFFANFTPEESDWYINFEVNANGVINFAFHKDRHTKKELTLEDAKGLNIKTEIFDDYWTACYKIKYSFIKKYYPAFDIEKCSFIKGNIYKCGDNTETVHYLSYFEVGRENPDFHRPEYFGKFKVEK